jgi:signal transduction histidine kinase
MADPNALNNQLQHEISERIRAEEELKQRTKLLSTLLDVSNLVSSTMELKPLLEAILDRLRIILDYNDARFFMVAGDRLRVFAHRTDFPREEEENRTIPLDSAPPGLRTILDRKPVLIPDLYGGDPAAVSFRSVMDVYLYDTLKGIGSWLGLPMIVKDRVVGILALGHSGKNFYRPDDIELGMAFANQAAIEFENAKLYNETIKRADELRTMLNIQQAITSRLDLDAVLRLIAEESRRLTDSHSTAVFLVDGGELVFSVFSGGGDSGLIGYRSPIESSIMGRNLLKGKSVRLEDVHSDDGADIELLIRAGVRSCLCVPLIAGTKPVGVIAATNKLTGDFDAEDERILNMFAPSAVIGIENARLYQEERRRHQEDKQRRYVAEGLRDMLAILNSDKSVDEIMNFIIKEAARLMGTDSGSIYRLNEDRDALLIETACGLPDGYATHMEVPLGAGAIGRAVSERTPIVVSDMAAFVKTSSEKAGPAPQLQWLRENCGGLIALPLICKDEIYGGIVLYFKKDRGKPGNGKEFSRDMIELAMTFADQAALVIDNARLRLQAGKVAVAAERNRLARDLHDAVTQTLFSASLIAEVLPRLWERNPEDGKKRLEDLRQLTRGALAEMRTLLFELRPATLVEAVLEELLRQLAESVTGRARIPVGLKIEGRGVLATEVKIALYRIAQEALNNVAKHSDAAEAEVNLQYLDEECGGKKAVRLKISDNGKGFEPGSITSEHLGVGIMRERAEAIGAELCVNSRPGAGTNIILYYSYRAG